jgi:hypothetical protein
LQEKILIAPVFSPTTGGIYYLEKHFLFGETLFIWRNTLSNNIRHSERSEESRSNSMAKDGYYGAATEILRYAQDDFWDRFLMF